MSGTIASPIYKKVNDLQVGDLVLMAAPLKNQISGFSLAHPNNFLDEHAFAMRLVEINTTPSLYGDTKQYVFEACGDVGVVADNGRRTPTENERVTITGIHPDQDVLIAHTRHRELSFSSRRLNELANSEQVYRR